MFFLASLIITTILVKKQTVLPGRASTPGILSLENSYLFASPLLSRANGEEKITISAFVLSDQGLGIEGKKVDLYSSPPLTANIVRGETDNLGMAVFEITSLTAGKYNLWAVVSGGGQIKQQVNISFTE